MAAVVTTGVRMAHPYAAVAVPDVSVGARGVTMLEGRSGSGTSAFVELCAGTAHVTAGRIRVLGHPPADPRIVRSRTVCRSTVALAPGASVRQHVRLFAHASGVDDAAFLDRFAEHGPLRWLEEPVERLSTGLARLAWVVLATTPRRDLVILDEPFLGLDGDAAAILHRELDEWARTSAVLLVDHGAREWTSAVGRIRMPDRA